jgi:hypothetical protein
VIALQELIGGIKGFSMGMHINFSSMTAPRQEVRALRRTRDIKKDDLSADLGMFIRADSSQNKTLSKTVKARLACQRTQK